ncbi:Hexose transporter 2 [Wickerhamomyces ciferrii]|uniref:Hexose transporter 2 n=1 Tax=Wickerhamomyces ciferrii (strain ATCC 14091 / BCRC 22168 / CBS 111 / JCM 3599 / NBRC 0793 / NRRL Y-1031 F-60-10) TaxID=1206466 RepID=K0KIW7_WICCF|nr:Hexose transporter 2 [Wickerhamomyces ciferrii]CCH41379.1 Hexose transporter 2 [Wickerhamomyces ciferrii]
MKGNNRNEDFNVLTTAVTPYTNQDGIHYERPPLYSLQSDIELMTGTTKNSKKVDHGANTNINDLEIAEEVESPNILDVDLKLIWSFRKVILLSGIISFSGFLFGWDTGVIGGIIQMDSFLSKLGYPKPGLEPGSIVYELKSYQTGLIVSGYHIGCIIGGFTIGRLSSYLGRKKPILIAMGVYITGIIVQITTSLTGKWYQFLIGRAINGLCIGSIAVLTPMFISETAPTAIRGSCTALYQINIASAILYGAIAVYACKEMYSNESEWIVPLSIGIAAALTVCVGIFFTPESARYLVSIGEYDKARASLRKVGDPNVERQLELLQAKIRVDNQASKTPFSFVFHKQFRKRVFIGVSLMTFQQMSGVDYFFYYGTTLFKIAGVSDSYVTMIVLATVNAPISLFGIYIVEKLGRKKTLLIGAALATTCLFIYSIVGTLKIDKDSLDPSVNRVPGIIMIVFTCFYFISFAPTWGTSVSVLVSELYPIHIKSHGIALATAFNWGSNFFIGFCTPIITDRIGYAFGFVFTGCMFLSFWVILFFVPETQGVSLEEIDTLFEKNG